MGQGRINAGTEQYSTIGTIQEKKKEEDTQQKEPVTREEVTQHNDNKVDTQRINTINDNVVSEVKTMKITEMSDKDLNNRLDEIISKSGGFFGKDERSEEEKQEAKEITEERTKRKPKEKDEDGGVEFLMSASAIDAEIRNSLPKTPYVSRWFEQTLSSTYTGNPTTGRFHITLGKKLEESEKAYKIETIVKNPFGEIMHTENKWYPKKAIVNPELL